MAIQKEAGAERRSCWLPIAARRFAGRASNLRVWFQDVIFPASLMRGLHFVQAAPSQLAACTPWHQAVALAADAAEAGEAYSIRPNWASSCGSRDEGFSSRCVVLQGGFATQRRVLSKIASPEVAPCSNLTAKDAPWMLSTMVCTSWAHPQRSLVAGQSRRLRSCDAVGSSTQFILCVAVVLSFPLPLERSFMHFESLFMDSIVIRQPPEISALVVRPPQPSRWLFLAAPVCSQ